MSTFKNSNALRDCRRTEDCTLSEKHEQFDFSHKKRFNFQSKKEDINGKDARGSNWDNLSNGLGIIFKSVQIYHQPSGKQDFVSEDGQLSFSVNNKNVHHRDVKLLLNNSGDRYGSLNKEMQANSHEFTSAPNPTAVLKEIDNSQDTIRSIKKGQLNKKWRRNGSSAHTNFKISRLKSLQQSKSNLESKKNKNYVKLSFSTENDDSGKNSLMESRVPADAATPIITTVLTPTIADNSISNFTHLTSQFTNAISNRKSGQHVSPTVENCLLNCSNKKNKTVATIGKSNNCNETLSAKTTRRRRNMSPVLYNSTAGAHSILTLLPQLFLNFILFSSFLLSSFNYCNVIVQSEIISNSKSHHQLNYDESILLHNATNSVSAPVDDTLSLHLMLSQSKFNHQLPQRSLNNSSTFGDNIPSLSASEEIVKEPFQNDGETNGESLQQLLSKPLDALDKNVLAKALWEALTPNEIHSIFGRHSLSLDHLKTVPKFEITKPRVSSHINNNERRKKRSTSNHTGPDEEFQSGKTIELEGFGRHFTVNIYPNQKLLDPYFVHLHRHENRSEILPQELVQKQLQCFYHGKALHKGEGENKLESGAVAMSLCGGLKGFILPLASPSSSNSDESNQRYHYVIHPLPDRILKSVPAKKAVEREESRSQFKSFIYEDNVAHDRHHIIFRRPGTPFSNIMEQHSSFKYNKNENRDSSQPRDTSLVDDVLNDKTDSFDELPTCMHHDIKTVNKPRFMKYAYKNNDHDYDQQKQDNLHDHVHNSDANVARSQRSSRNMNNDELDALQTRVLNSGKTLLKNQERNRMKPIISTELDAGSNINDLESLTDEDKIRLKSLPEMSTSQHAAANVNSGHHFRRQKRSTGSLGGFDAETIDPFTYKPINLAPDSYWIQLRDRGNNNGGGLFRGSTSGLVSDGFGNYNGNRRLSSQFSYDDITSPARFSISSGPSTSFQPSFWHHNTPPSIQSSIHDGSSSSSRSSSILPHNLPSRPSQGSNSRYDEIPTTGSDFDEDDDTGVAGSDHMTWSKGILVFESSGSNEDRHYPGKDVQFYTKNNGNKRKSKGISTSSSIVTSTRSTSSSSGNNSPTRSFDWFNGGVPDTVSSGSINSAGRPWSTYDKNRTTKSYSLSDSSSSSSTRKGRRDEGVFGDKWKSSLDSEIFWADRSNEINKQAKFEDLSNVKDKPPSHLTIETAVFIDKDLYKHMQQNFPEDTQGEVTRIVLAMINAVQLLYQDPSLGHRVDFVLKRLEVLESDPPTLIRPYDIDRFLTNFCKWQKTENPANDADPLHWDHALILTGLDLYVVHQSGKISNQVVGLAPVAGMCTRSSSCTVNEGRHFESVFVVAHEIGHNLGMRHDGPQAENNCDPTSHIMSPTLGSGKITWSPCSKKYLDLFLDTSQAKCLFDKAKPERWLDHNGDGRLPGERFDADRQCVLKYGRGSYHATQQPLEDVCRDLHCRREFFTWTSHPALDGTRCSAADDMWCRAGKCVPKLTGLSSSAQNSFEFSGTRDSTGSNDGFSGGSNHLSGSETAAYATQKALDGGWGKWSPFTDCSSACLHSDDGTLNSGSNGVRLAARRCDSPRPENGGRQCSGPDRRYKTCSPHKICSKTPSRTTVSQYAAEVCSRAAQVDTELTGRGYMSSSNDPERACSVWCETNDNSGPRSRGWSFPDGTVCKRISLSKNAQTFCVAGRCQEFTCSPYSHFRLSEDECSFSSSNDVIPNSKKQNAQDSWFGGSGGVKINHRSGKIGWTDWEIQSECKLPCLAPAKGLQLVKRQCSSDDALCTGLSLSVRLCKPDKFAVQSNGCSRLQTPFEHATNVCSKYSDKVSGLSGIGMQLSPTKDDGDRPCRIGCQDASIAYRFYMVNGEEGWFPAGTDCSRGDQDKKAYCMAGKCIDFGEDDTPLYQISSNMMGSLFQQQRSKRQAVYNIMEPLKTEPGMDESSLKELVKKFSQETGNYPSIVQRSRNNPQKSGSVDFSRPIFISTPSTNIGYNYDDSQYGKTFASNTDSKQYQKPNFFNSYDEGRLGRGRSLDIIELNREHNTNQKAKSPSFSHRSGSDQNINSISGRHVGRNLKPVPVEGSFYEWRKILSDCSVACGEGIQEVIVQCISGDTVVNDSLCQGRPRPGYSGYITCRKRGCARSSSSSSSSSDSDDGKGSHLWKWIQSILPPKNI